MISKRKQNENEWLALLIEALADRKVKIQVNHRFKYKGKNLGTFLTDAKRKANTGILQRIENTGFNYKNHNKNPQDYFDRFIDELEKEKDPIKQRYITRFNAYILPKKDILSPESKQRLHDVWKYHFRDVRKWTTPDTTENKIHKWKQFRYNKEINPDGKWITTRGIMGSLYGWVYTRKTGKQPMGNLLEYFDEKELSELKKEGFLFNTKK